ncbi:hypothetical protein FMUND_3173 [Fusarium mundagurra]|uniref:NACHT domain-containing protein n=1 Tax=Fusarium mundagurra TaxID=1567541 RepID=A0A8H6DNU0_9HYPO|nr:hypothetical protein FMUND_3173 [Fusarium mundagurra]
MADPSTYTVGWICALTTELVAAKSFFDEEYEVTLEAQAPGDNNCYSFGRMGRHDVVVASLPRAEYGIAPAASVARDMLRTFPNIRVGLMVGIGGGAPSPEHDVRLGDVVVSVPSGDKGGVIHHNRGKTVQQQEFQLTGSLNQPPQLLLTAVGSLESHYEAQGHELNERIEEALNARPRLRKRYARPLSATDMLYKSSHIHQESPKSASCKDNCGVENLITREARGDDDDDPMIHYGLIASSDKLMKDATIRDKLAKEEGVLCFEMEAAGLMNHFPCLIVRGICDYADSHKNKQWHGFAAMTAAAYAKELLQKILPTKIQQQKPLAKLLGGSWCRNDGSGQWFIENPAYQEFKAGLRQHLWLHGWAGCGKTVLSSRIFDDLKDTSGIVTLAHYFDFNDAEKQSLNGLLRSLAFQLCQYGGEAASARLHELFRSCGSGSNEPDELQLESCITSMLRNTDNRVFVLIDALDESRSRNSLLTWIGRLTAENAQFLLTARPEDEIQTQIVRSIGEENCLSLDKRAVNSDIKSYVFSLLNTHPKFTEKGLSEELRNEICTKIGEGAEGMFRWAACQMDALEACLTPNAVHQALMSLPRNLYETYDRMLETIPPHQKGDCIRLLQFILNSKQPLSPAEAVEILAIRSDRQDRLTFEPENRLFNPSNITRYCPGMISIVTVVRRDPPERELIEEEVHLTHFSVKEFLGQKNTFCPLNAAIVITQTLLAYLRDINGPFYGMCVDFPLATRAADTWTRFASRAQSDEKTVEIIAKFLLGTENLSKCYRISTSDIDWYQTSGPRTHPIPFYKRSMGAYCREDSGLHYACKGGLQETAVYIMKHAPLNVQAEQKEASLVTAIRSKHLELVEILLEHGVNPDASHPSYGTAINNASNLGLTKLVRVLIEAGADVNIESTGKDCCNAALCVASEHGHLDIVEDLLKAGAHIGVHDSVRLALENGHDSIVELLTERACEIRPVSCELFKSAASHGTIEFLQRLLDTEPGFLCKSRALTSACKAGRLEIAGLLLSNGAKVDYYSPKPEDYLAIYEHPRRREPLVFRENSLVLAAKSGNAHLVRMLIDVAFGLGQGVGMNREFEVATSIYVKKAFIKALEGHHQTVIRTLLNAVGSHAYTDEYATLRAASEVRNLHILKNFSIALQGREFLDIVEVMKPLHEILLGDHKHIIQPLLKEAGSRYFPTRMSYGKEIRAPIEVAATIGSAVIVSQLIQAGVDIGGSLYYAIIEGHEHVVRLLLDNKIDVNLTIGIQGQEFSGNPLHAALSLESITGSSIAHMLLDYGADCNYVNEEGSPPLQIAVESGRVDIVQRLLNLGGTVSKVDDEGRTPLHAASNEDIIRILLEAGANANARDVYGRTPFHKAARKGNVEGMKLLLRSGADMFALTDDGDTALHRALMAPLPIRPAQVLEKRIKFLLDIGLGVNDRGRLGSSPLHKACLLSLTDIAALLIEKGADVNAKSDAGMSPFQMIMGLMSTPKTIKVSPLYTVWPVTKAEDQ